MLFTFAWQCCSLLAWRNEALPTRNSRRCCDHLRCSEKLTAHLHQLLFRETVFGLSDKMLCDSYCIVHATRLFSSDLQHGFIGDGVADLHEILASLALLESAEDIVLHNCWHNCRCLCLDWFLENFFYFVSSSSVPAELLC